MSQYVIISARANGHLGEIYDYIADASAPAVAESYTDSIVKFCENLLPFPMRGIARNDLLEGLRALGFRKRAVIAFVVTDEIVEIHGIYYGGQDWERRFREEHPQRSHSS